MLAKLHIHKHTQHSQNPLRCGNHGLHNDLPQIVYNSQTPVKTISIAAGKGIISSGPSLSWLQRTGQMRRLLQDDEEVSWEEEGTVQK